MSKTCKKYQEVDKMLLFFVDDYMKNKGYAPTYREIQEAVGVKSISTVHEHIDYLTSQGKIERTGNSPRAIRVVDNSDDKDKVYVVFEETDQDGMSSVSCLGVFKADMGAWEFARKAARQRLVTLGYTEEFLGQKLKQSKSKHGYHIMDMSDGELNIYRVWIEEERLK